MTHFFPSLLNEQKESCSFHLRLICLGFHPLHWEIKIKDNKEDSMVLVTAHSAHCEHASVLFLQGTMTKLLLRWNLRIWKWSPRWTLWYTSICSYCHHSRLAARYWLSHTLSTVMPWYQRFNSSHGICCAFGRAVILWNCESPGFKHCLLMLWFRFALCLLNFHVYTWKWLRRMECQFHLHPSIQTEVSLQLGN